MISNKITRRWLRNSFGVIVAIVVLLELFAAFAVRRYYYSNVEQTLQTRVDIIANVFQQYSKDSTKDFSALVREYVAQFEYKDQMELMIVDRNGNISVTSSGFEPAEETMPDYEQAQQQNSRTGMQVGSLGATKKAMKLSLLSPVQNEDSISAVRLATDLSEVDKQIAGIVLMMLGIGLVVLALVLFSSSYFMNSIVRPIGAMGETTRRIAQGDFDARLMITNDDEIGELAAMINYMAGELGTAEKLKNDFISSVSHELRTPLTAIQGWAETLLYDEGQDKTLLNKGMNVIIGETQRLSGMVEELLDFSRMQSGRLKLIKGKMDAIAELSEAVFMYTQRAERDGIDLIYQEEEQPAPIYGDKNRIRQVFINVIDNAIKYSDPGDTVTVTSHVAENTLTIQVADTGIGISKEDLPQVLTKFYKANSTRRGSGIGLAVAKEIVERHDGDLTVDSVQEHGTTITITLPIYTKQTDITKVEEVEDPLPTLEKEE